MGMVKTKMTAKITNRTIGDVAEFAEISTQIDELRAKLKSLVGTTSTGIVETVDSQLAKAMSSLEDYFEWAGCYDDEPEVKAMRQEIREKDAQDLTREELDLAWADLRKRVKESDEPIPVRGILHKPKDSVLEVHNYAIKAETFEDGIDPDPDDWETQSKIEGQPTSKIEKYFVIVCEEDYAHAIRKSEWDKYLNAKKVKIVEDAADLHTDFIWKEEWIVKDGDDSLYQQLHSLVGRETLLMTKTLIVEGDF